MFDGRGDRNMRKKALVPAAVLLAVMLTVQISVPITVLSNLEQPLGWVGEDFIISYPDGNDANEPSIAITPSNYYTIGKETAGSIHVVWHEFDDSTGWLEIHYSMSQDSGRTWTGEHGDFIISGKSERMYSGDATRPSVTVDSFGSIHVVWAQQNLDLKGLWEVYYTRSENNGQTWLPSTQVSFMSTGKYDAHEISAPQITAGVVPTHEEPDPDNPDWLHVAWSAYDIPMNMREVFYIRSRGGDSWPEWGHYSSNIISLIGESEEYHASDPAITISGDLAQFVHVSWTQMGIDNQLDEVYYLRSDSWGESWNPEDQSIISGDYNDAMTASDVSMTSYLGNVHVVWSRTSEKGGGGWIHYVGCPYNGDSLINSDPVAINNNDDQNVPAAPSIAVTGELGEAYVYWCERNDTSDTVEVHKSHNPNPLKNPWDWSGLEQDIIISPMTGGDTSNVAAAIGAMPPNRGGDAILNRNGNKTPQVVWQKPIMEYGGPMTEEVHTEPPDGWILNLEIDGDGYVDKDPDKTGYHNENVTLTANPDTGWSFHKWTGDIESGNNPETIYMDTNKTVKAYFVRDQYTLTVNTFGDGSVSQLPGSPYYYEDTVQLTANPDFGWQFSHWTGDASGNSNPTNVFMDSDKTVNAHFTQNIYDINLNAGWNLVSLPFIQGNTSVASVLSSIDGNYGVVKYYDTLDTANHWKTYRVGSPVNTLFDIDHTMGFWLHATAACTLSIYGDIPSSTGIHLYAGWNLVGYPSLDTTKTVATALAGTGYDLVEGYQSTLPYVKLLSDTDIMMPGEGYWIHVPADTLWTVDW